MENKYLKFLQSIADRTHEEEVDLLCRTIAAAALLLNGNVCALADRIDRLVVETGELQQAIREAGKVT